MRRLIRFRGLTPSDALYRALTYAIEQFPHLEPCFLEGQIKFDNNLTDNAIRPTKPGHKNWMFIGGEHTGWRSAVVDTFVEQIRRHGAAPFAYFEWVFEKLMHSPAPEELEALLPANWIGCRARCESDEIAIITLESDDSRQPELTPRLRSENCDRFVSVYSRRFHRHMFEHPSVASPLLVGSTPPGLRSDGADPGWNAHRRAPTSDMLAGLRAELLRLERHPVLAHSSRQRQLLRYLFEECVAGRSERISQYTIAFECFGKGDGFDAGVNTIVRSHALRLRKTLKKLAGPEGSHRILMAERGYSLVLERADRPVTVPCFGFRHSTIGIMEAELREGLEIEPSFPKQLAHAMVEAMTGSSDLFSPVGPLPRDANRTQGAMPPHDPTDYLLGGEIVAHKAPPCLHLWISESSGGRRLWTIRTECKPAATLPPGLRELAGELASQISSDWGAICANVAKRARSKTSDELAPHEAVAVARQYLTHFHFEHLERCVRSLRRWAATTDESSVPATLAVILGMACAVEPRWLEPLNRSEIRDLAARAARLDPEAAWTRLAFAVSAMVDGRRAELVEMAKRADREPHTPRMLLGAFGSLLCFQAVETELGGRMIGRFIEGMSGYPRLVHLSLAMCALAAGDTATAHRELANYGVPWGWASPLVSAGCAALDGDVDIARADWQRVLDAFPEFPKRWRNTVATQWHEDHLLSVFRALESAGIRTACLNPEAD